MVVTPLTNVVQPVHWCDIVVSAELLRIGIVAVEVSALDRIPPWALICEVSTDADVREIDIWDIVAVNAGCGVIGVRAVGGVNDGLEKWSVLGHRRLVKYASTYSYTASIFLYSTIRECFAVGVLAIPHRLRLPVLEPHHGVLPISDVIVDLLSQVVAAVVERVEVEVESIDFAVSVITDDDGTGDRAVRLALSRRDSIEPSRMSRHIIIRCQIDIVASKTVQLIDTVESERRGRILDVREV